MDGYGETCCCSYSISYETYAFPTAGKRFVNEVEGLLIRIGFAICGRKTQRRLAG